MTSKSSSTKEKISSRPILVAKVGMDDWSVVIGERLTLKGHRYLTWSGHLVKNPEKTTSYAVNGESPSLTLGEEVSNPSWSFFKKCLFLTKRYANSKNWWQNFRSYWRNHLKRR